MFKLISRLCTLSLLASTVCAAVHGIDSLQTPLSLSNYDDEHFSPMGDLGVLSTSEFASLAHPLFPDYNVRIKRSNFCDGTVR